MSEPEKLTPTQIAELKAVFRDALSLQLMAGIEAAFREVFPAHLAEKAMASIRGKLDSDLANKAFEEAIDAIGEETQQE